MNTLICRHGPYGSSYGQQALDLALIHAAFDQPLRMLFQAQGIWLLKQEQNAQVILQKTYTSGFGLLSLYDINDLWVVEDDLYRFNLTPADLQLPVQLLKRAQLAQFLAQSQHIYCL